MDITRRKTLNEMIDESEDLKLRWQQLDGLPVGSSERALTLDDTASVLAGWVPQGRFISPGTPERRALRSMLDYWVGRLGDQGRGEEGIETIESFDPEAGVVLDVDRCPYPGLLPYDANDRACFFGREALVEQVRNHLDLPGSRIFLIIGSSGSGKSSLALAGVIPKLAERHAGEWLFAPRMTPGVHPMASLAASVSAAIGKPENSMALEKALVAAPAEAQELVGRACESKPLLLLVDQLEELLTMCLDGKERAAFAAVLVSLSDSKPPGDGFACRTLLTLRADYKTRLESSEARPLYVRLVDEHNSADMTSIGFADIRRAIQQPADAVGLRFVPSTLIDSLASQTAGLANGLPLLQFALQLLWATRPGYEKGQPKDLVTEAMVKALPDVQRALGQVADGLYEGFNAVQKRLCERLMQELIVLDDTFEEPLRRRRDEAELVKVLHRHYPNPADTECVLEAFVKAHLIQRFGVKPETQIEVAHEALLRHWERIHKLLNSDAVKGRLHLIKEVGKAAEQWDKNGRRNDYLTLPAERLALAVEHDSDGWFADPLPKDFIAACHRHQIEAQQQAQQVELAKEQAKAAVLASQRLRTKVWGFGSGLAALLALVVAWGYTASDLQRKGKSDALASRAILLNDQDPALGVHIALTALLEDATNERAQYALRNAMNEVDAAFAIKIEPLGEPIVDARFSADGSTLVVASEKRVHLLNATTLKKTRDPIDVQGFVLQAWLVAGNRWLLVKLADGSALLQPLDVSAPLPLKCPGADNAFSVAVSADLQHVALGCMDGQIVHWSLSGALPVETDTWSPPPSKSYTVTAMAFSQDSAYLASGDAAGVLRLWKSGAGKAVFDTQDKRYGKSEARHSAAVRVIAFDPTSPQLLVSGSDDKTVIFWTLPLSGVWSVKDKPAAWSLPTDREVTAVRLARHNGSPVVLATAGKRVRLWTRETSTESVGHDDWVNDFDVSEDGKYIVTASSDGTARVWSTVGGAPIAKLRGHRDQVTRALFMPGKATVLTASRDGTLRVWSFERSSRLLASRAGRWILGASFDGSGRRVVVCGEAIESPACSVIDIEGEGAPTDLRSFEAAWHVSFPSWSADDKWVLATAATNDVEQRFQSTLWDSRSGEDVTPNWLKKQMTAWFASGSAYVLTLDSQRVMAIWDASALVEGDSRPKHQWDGPSERTQVRLSPDGLWIAEIIGNRAQLSRANDPKAAAIPLSEHRGEIRMVNFSADSHFVVTASADRTACVWPLALLAKTTGKPVCPVELKEGHTASLSSAAFSPDGTLVATASADNTIRVWNAVSGNPLVTLRVHGDAVNDVQFSPDGKSILSASDDGTAKLTRCDACTMTIEQLRDRVNKDVLLAKDDQEALRTLEEGAGGWRAKLFNAINLRRLGAVKRVDQGRAEDAP